jgi:FtsZ-binding cell division protein ZapB
MADKINAKLDQVLSTVQIIQTDLSGVKSDVSDLKTDVSTLKTDISTLRSDVIIIKDVQGTQGMQIRAIQSDLGSLKNSTRGQSKELSRLATLFEDFEDKFQAAGELNS